MSGVELLAQPPGDSVAFAPSSFFAPSRFLLLLVRHLLLVAMHLLLVASLLLVEGRSLGALLFKARV